MKVVERRVLVVEDDDDIREIFAQILEEAGYVVTWAANGQDALVALRSGAPLPGVIFLDLMMPIMDGWAFCRSRWKSRTLREIPVILISAVDMSGSNRPTGVDAFLSKPLDVEEVTRLAARIAGRKAAHARPIDVLH